MRSSLTSSSWWPLAKPRSRDSLTGRLLAFLKIERAHILDMLILPVPPGHRGYCHSLDLSRYTVGTGFTAPGKGFRRGLFYWFLCFSSELGVMPNTLRNA